MRKSHGNGNRGSRRRILIIIAIAASLGIAFLAGHTIGRGQPQTITPPGGAKVEFRYAEKTRWFEVWEDGHLRAEFTATELLLENVADPPGWRERVVE